jgi:hypothetical protein
VKGKTYHAGLDPASGPNRKNTGKIEESACLAISFSGKTTCVKYS